MRDIIALLKEEGMTDNQITYEKDFHFEDNTGFFSWRIEHGVPFISHFYIDVEKRDGHNAITLYHKFRDMIREQGYDRFIAEVLPGKEVFNKFIKTCLGCHKPYATANGCDYYLIEV